MAQLKKFAEDLRQLDSNVVADDARRGKPGIPFPGDDLDQEKDDFFEETPEDPGRVANGFWAEGEKALGPDEDFYGDDITSDGDGHLQTHKYLREYARLIAWELPLLSRTSTLAPLE